MSRARRVLTFVLRSEVSKDFSRSRDFSPAVSQVFEAQLGASAGCLRLNMNVCVYVCMYVCMCVCMFSSSNKLWPEMVIPRDGTEPSPEQTAQSPVLSQWSDKL